MPRWRQEGRRRGYCPVSSYGPCWTRRRPSEARWLHHPAFLGVLFGVTVGESPWVALAVFLVGLLLGPFQKRRDVGTFLLLGAIVSALLLGPAAATASLEDLRELAPWPKSAHFPGVFPLEFLRDVGLFASAGLVAFLVPGGPGRALWIPVGTVVLLDVLVPAARSGAALSSVEGCAARSALHLLLLATVAPVGALGLRRVLDWALGLGVIAAGQGAALLTVLALAVSTAGLEDAHPLPIADGPSPALARGRVPHWTICRSAPWC